MPCWVQTAIKSTLTSVQCSSLSLSYFFPFAALHGTGPNPLQGEPRTAHLTSATGTSRDRDICYAAAQIHSSTPRNLWPGFRDLRNEFASIVSELLKVLHSFKPLQFESLLVFLRERLKHLPADLPKGTMKPLALMEHLQNHWGYLEIDLIEDIIQHIQCVSGTASSLLQSLTKYKENGCNKVTHTLDECKEKKVYPEPPPNYTNPISFHLYQILQDKESLVATFGVCPDLFGHWNEEVKGLKCQGFTRPSNSALLLSQ